MTIKGYPDQKKASSGQANFATVSPVREQQHALDVISHHYVQQIGTDAAETGSTTKKIKATAHVSKVGDVISFTSGNLDTKEYRVFAVETNFIIPAEEMSESPANGDTFSILRPKYAEVDDAGKVKTSITLNNDTDYGTVGANTLRTAAQIGNATGAAAFGAGVNGAQVLRTSPATDAPHLLATRHEAAATPLSTRLSDGSAFAGFDHGASSAGLRTAAVLGNSGGALAYGSGVNGAQVLRTNPATDAPHLLATRHEAAATPLSVRLGDGTNFFSADFGLSSGGLRVAAILGNANGALAYDSGASSAQTLRAVLATRHEALTTPLAAQLSNGAGALDYDSGAASSATLRAVLATRHETLTTPLATRLTNGTSALDTDSGAAGTATLRSVLATRHEAAATPVAVRISNGAAFSTPSPKGRAYADSARHDYSDTTVTTAAWTELIASTAAEINHLIIFDSSGQTMELGTGAVGSEARALIIPPGGLTSGVPLNIASGSRVSIRAVSADADTGEINLTGLT